MRKRKPKQQHIILDLTDADLESRPLVEDKIPLPPRHRKINSLYPFGLMKPGQSFFIPGDPLPTVRKLCQAVANYRKKAADGREFVVRSRNKKQPSDINPKKEEGARVWRVE